MSLSYMKIVVYVRNPITYIIEYGDINTPTWIITLYLWVDVIWLM